MAFSSCLVAGAGAGALAPLRSPTARRRLVLLDCCDECITFAPSISTAPQQTSTPVTAAMRRPWRGARGSSPAPSFGIGSYEPAIPEREPPEDDH